jgi:hypothetical protein
MSVGIIQVAVFREMEDDAALADDGMQSRRGHASRRAASRATTPKAGAPADGARADRRARPMRRRMVPPRTGQLGTELGEARMSRVRRVGFERDAQRAAQIVAVRYDNAAGLQARGIQVRPPMMRRPTPISHRPMRRPMSRR